MKRRRTYLVLAAVALPLSLIATPARAVPTPASGVGPPVEWLEGTLQRIKTNSNKVVLTDGRVLRYDKNDLIIAQHLYDLTNAEGPYVDCDLRDTGGEATVARFARSGLPVSVDYLELRRMREVSTFIFSIDTCDGVVDPADITP